MYAHRKWFLIITKWASPLQLPIPLTHEGCWASSGCPFSTDRSDSGDLAHFERRCAAALAAFLCASCASPGGFLYHRKVRGLSYDIKQAGKSCITYTCLPGNTLENWFFIALFFQSYCVQHKFYRTIDSHLAAVNTEVVGV